MHFSTLYVGPRNPLRGSGGAWPPATIHTEQPDLGDRRKVGGRVEIVSYGFSGCLVRFTLGGGRITETYAVTMAIPLL
jgi:hypothetical protein